MILSVIIPTYHPADTPNPKLLALLGDIAATREERDAFEVIIVIDGDDTPPIERRSLPTGIATHVLTKQHGGPAAARNLGISRARGQRLLFLDDDMRLGPKVIPAHVAHARRHPECEDALLGRVGWPVHRLVSPWSRLLAGSSMRFFWDRMRDGHLFGFRHFWTINLSVRRDLVEAAGGFDERFPAAMHEDIELGWRLERRFGTRVRLDDGVRCEHDHPLSPRDYLEREHRSGRSAATARTINRSFHDDVWPWIDDAAAQLDALRSTLRTGLSDAFVMLQDWAAPPQGDRGATPEPSAAATQAAYLAHVPLKRVAFLHGYLDRPFDALLDELAPAVDAAGAPPVLAPAPGDRAPAASIA